MASPAVTLTFTLVDTANNPIKGKVVLTLDNFTGIPRIPATNVIAKLIYTAYANSSGQGSVTLWGNYQINQPNSFYQISVYPVDSQGNVSNAPSSTNNYRFSTAGTFDLDSLTPINSSTSPVVVPSGQPVLLNPQGTQSISTYGLEAPWFGSQSTNLAESGIIRLADSDTIDWRNNANSADLALGINANDQLEFNGKTIGTSQGIDVQAFGAKGDGKHTWSMTTTATSTTVTLVPAANFGSWFDNTQFTQADVGATILIYGAGSGNLTYKGTISSVINGTTAHVSPAVPNSTSEAEAIWGQHDDGPAFLDAIAATNALATKISVPDGVYLSSVAFDNLSSPFFYGIVGGGSQGTIIAITDITLNQTVINIQDAPFGFEMGGFTLFCQGQQASSLTNANGIWFSTNVQIPKERLYYHDVRVSQFPQKGLIAECTIVSLFENFTCDNGGQRGINFAPANGFAGTSTTVNSGYANNCGQSGWQTNGLFYSVFNNCASDSNVDCYDEQDCTGNTYNSCGSEGATGNPWNIDEVTSCVINSPYIEIDQAVVATQVMFNFENNCAAINLNVPFCVINGNVTNGILIASNCAYIQITHPIINNFSFTSAGPVTDLGYANLLIYDEFEDGLTFKTNDNQTYYNWACAGNDINIKNASCGSLTPNFAPAVAPGDVSFSGWGSGATLNYTEGFQTAFGIGINCLGLAHTLSAVAAAVTVHDTLSQAINNGLTTTYVGTFSPTVPLGEEVFISGFSNAGNNGNQIVVFSSATQIICSNPIGVNETAVADAAWATAAYTGVFSPTLASGTKVLLGGFTNPDNVGEFTVVTCSGTVLTVDNGAAALESHAGTAWSDDQTANPTITVTYATPYSVPPTPVVSDFLSDDFAKDFVISDNSTDHIVFTLRGTPNNGDSYGLFCHIFNSF